MVFLFFFFNDTATTEIYTLSLHDALPIYPMHLIKVGEAWYWDWFAGLSRGARDERMNALARKARVFDTITEEVRERSEEHTSELQSLRHLVCRLLLEKKKKIYSKYIRSVN